MEAKVTDEGREQLLEEIRQDMQGQTHRSDEGGPLSAEVMAKLRRLKKVERVTVTTPSGKRIPVRVAIQDEPEQDEPEVLAAISARVARLEEEQEPEPAEHRAEAAALAPGQPEADAAWERDQKHACAQLGAAEMPLAEFRAAQKLGKPTREGTLAACAQLGLSEADFDRYGPGKYNLFEPVEKVKPIADRVAEILGVTQARLARHLEERWMAFHRAGAVSLSERMHRLASYVCMDDPRAIELAKSLAPARRPPDLRPSPSTAPTGRSGELEERFAGLSDGGRPKRRPFVRWGQGEDDE